MRVCIELSDKDVRALQEISDIGGGSLEELVLESTRSFIERIGDVLKRGKVWIKVDNPMPERTR